MSDELQRLTDLHQRGALTDDEFARAMSSVLSKLESSHRSDSATAAVNAVRRSWHDRWLGGLCGGIAELTGVASWLWRLMFVLLAFCAGSGVVVYALLWLLVPQGDDGFSHRTHGPQGPMPRG